MQRTAVIREFRPESLDDAIALWSASEGVGSNQRPPFGAAESPAIFSSSA